MSCRCAERRQVIVDMAAGKTPAIEAARFVGRTLAQDASAAIAAARARLASRVVRR